MIARFRVQDHDVGTRPIDCQSEDIGGVEIARVCFGIARQVCEQVLVESVADVVHIRGIDVHQETVNFDVNKGIVGHACVVADGGEADGWQVREFGAIEEEARRGGDGIEIL